MDKSNLSKYVIIALLIGGVFYVGSLNKKISTLEKTVGIIKNGNTTGTADQGSNGANQAAAKPTVGIDEVKKAFDQAVIKFGDTSKKIVALEISDPSCPYCQIAGGKNKELNSSIPQFKLVADGGTYVAPVPELKKLVDEGKAAFALIYTPGHGNGELGMRALYCAFDAGKFWEANDLIMSSAGYDLMNNTLQNDMTKSTEMAEFLSSAVDKTTMKSCLDSGKYKDQLAADSTLAQSIGIQGTPGFFINATEFAGAYSYKSMEPAVTEALK